jgi:sporulation protein YlmC with PRC-barrel domain
VGFGPDAVVIDDSAHLRPAGSDYEQRVAAGRLELRGRRVLTDGGFDVGPLTDVEFDETSGEVELIETRRARVRGTGLLTIGPYAVVVAHAAVVKPKDPT